MDVYEICHLQEQCAHETGDFMQDQATPIDSDIHTIEKYRTDQVPGTEIDNGFGTVYVAPADVHRTRDPTPMPNPILVQHDRDMSNWCRSKCIPRWWHSLAIRFPLWSTW